jgi:hypothetical protein
MKEVRWGKRGATQVIVAIAMPALVGLAAFSVDVGHLVVKKQRLSQLCDAAAKAGGADLPAVQSLSESQAMRSAERVAEEYARANGAGAANVQFAARATVGPNGNRLEVTAREDVPMAFARIWGWTHRSVQARAVAEREPEAGWVPIALETRKLDWGAIGLSRCSPGQWWVTGVNGMPLESFLEAFRSGSRVALQPGDTIQLTRLGEGYRPQIISAARERLSQKAHGRDQVRVLVIEGAVGPDGRPVSSGQDVATATFQTYARIQLTGVDEPDPALDLRNALGLKRLDTGSGPLGPGDTVQGGRVRLVE